MKKIRQNCKSPFCAFGDDSSYRNVLTYAYAVFHRKNISKAKQVLRKIKKQYRVPVDFPIHCRILFSGNQREKANLSHVSSDTVKLLISDLIDQMNQVPCLLRYSYCILPRSGEIFLKACDEGRRIVHDEPKGVMGILSQACFLPVRNQPLLPGPELCEIFPSRDNTKIRFIGKNRCRADAYSSGITIEKAGKKDKVRIPFNVGEHELQQVADVYAYICSHALCTECDDDFFVKQLNKVKYYTSAVGYADREFGHIGLSRPENT